MTFLLKYTLLVLLLVSGVVGCDPYHLARSLRRGASDGFRFLWAVVEKETEDSKEGTCPILNTVAAIAARAWRGCG